MLDKRQLDTIKGLIDMNLGETVEEFEKPSSVILDPVAQVCVVCRAMVQVSLHLCCIQLESLVSRLRHTAERQRLVQ